MEKPLIQIENLSKAYRIGVRRDKADTLVGAIKQTISSPFNNLKRLNSLDTSSAAQTETQDDLLWALKDINLNIFRGDVVGVIGHNGAGKSTLLKIISRITDPTHGRVTLRGRVSSLLEVGTGFHPELTGRENVYMNGSILGMTKKEIKSKFDEIVEFAGVEKFLDTPTKRYSSGMQTRLAFAVAAHLEPEILIVDEVLAVGDAGFQKKCIGKMHDVSTSGRTVVFVSHNLGAIESICTSGIVIQGGQQMFAGSVNEATCYYRELVQEKSQQLDSCTVQERSRFVKELEIKDTNGKVISFTQVSKPVEISLSLDFEERKIQDFRMRILIDDIAGTRMLSLEPDLYSEVNNHSHGRVKVTCQIPALTLAPGNYSIGVLFKDSREVLEEVTNLGVLQVEDGEVFDSGKNFVTGLFVANTAWTIEPG